MNRVTHRSVEQFAFARAWIAKIPRLHAVFLMSLLVGAPCLATPARTDNFQQPAASDWPTVGGDWSNTRYSQLTQINTQTVKRLSGAWVFSFEEGGASRVTPVIKDGVMFVTAGRTVYALNAKTGAKFWTHQTAGESGDTQGAPPNATGVGLGGGMVFVGLQNGRIIALDERTGALRWSTQTGVNEPKKGQTVTAAPTYIDGALFAGLSNGDWHLRGRLTALDAAKGDIRWQLYSVPSPGESGHETWPASGELWKTGGGGIWTSSPVDAALGLVYATTGNPMPPFAGDLRPGRNLYTDSVLAVDMKSGALKWHYQLVHHDVFEADAGTPVVLYDWNGRKALAVMRADGHLFQFDRDSGAALLPIEERAVPQSKSQLTSPTQPFPSGGESILMSCDDWKRETIPEGFTLGCMWTPPASPPPSPDPQNLLAPFPSVRRAALAYSPRTRYFYAQGTSMLNWPRRSHDPYFLDWTGSIPGLKAYGELAAIDSLTGRIAWRQRVPAWRHGGLPGALYRHGSLLVTAGDLLFRSVGDGHIEAYDAKSGAVTWRFYTGEAGITGSPASYAVDGEQFIAVPVGRSVWAFTLDGKIPAAQAPELPSAEDEFSSVLAQGQFSETDTIETTALHRAPFGAASRYFIDEFAFSPYRAKVKRGAQVLFVNNGLMRHEFIARDQSWGTGPLHPAQEAWVRFEQPGKYAYICKDHPWVYGQILVEDNTKIGKPEPRSSEAASPLTSVDAQATMGAQHFKKSCSACHGEDLAGVGQAPALAGAGFAVRWKNSTARDLLDRIRTTMPQAQPNSLAPDEYLAIVAYLIRTNRMWSVDSRTQNAVLDTESAAQIQLK